MMLMSPGSTLEETRLVLWPATSLQRGIMGQTNRFVRLLRPTGSCVTVPSVWAGAFRLPLAAPHSCSCHGFHYVPWSLSLPGCTQVPRPSSDHIPPLNCNIYSLEVCLTLTWKRFFHSQFFFPLRESGTVCLTGGWHGLSIKAQPANPGWEHFFELPRHRCKNTHMWS